MRVAVFSGTTEGKEIIEYLVNKDFDVTVSVATQYGKTVMEDIKDVDINIGRLDKNEIADFIRGFDYVVDATHPYAQLVTQNIKSACKQSNIKYIRLLRDDFNFENVIEVEGILQAVGILKNTEGNIFVSTGSKELHLYSDLKDRLVVRALPVKEAEEKCEILGIENVIYKKGPFSYEENLEAFKMYNARWLVTKSSGKNGGFEEKLKAAKNLNMGVVVIKRPEEKGMSMNEVKIFFDKEVNKCQ